MFWIGGVVRYVAKVSIGNLGYAASDKVVQVERYGAIGDGFISIQAHLVSDD